MKEKLYEIANDLNEVAQLDLPASELKDTLDGLKGTFEIKAESIGKVMANWDGDIEAISAEIKRLQARKKTLENRKQSIRDYLQHNMELTGINKIECPLFTITLAKGRPKAVITDHEAVPAWFKTTTTEIKIDTPAILKELNAGENIPGCELGVSAPSLRIK